MPFFLLPVLVLWAVVALRKRLRIYQRVLSKQQLNGIVSRINNCNVSLLNDTKLSDIDRSIIKRSMVNETNGNYIDSGSPNDDHDFLNCMVEIQLLFAEMYGTLAKTSLQLLEHLRQLF